MANRLEQLQQMLLQEPNDEFLQYAIAMEYFSVNDFEKALNGLKAILNANPDYLAAYYQMGKCYEELKQFENAKDIYKKGIEVAKKQNKNKTLNELNEALFLLDDE